MALSSNPVDGWEIDRSNHNRRAEELWRVQSEELFLEHLLLTLLRGKVFTIQGGREEFLRYENLVLTIPAGAFAMGEKVSITLQNLRTHGDFALSQVPMDFRGGNRFSLLESAGMFHIAFASERGVQMQPQVEIGVELSSLNTGINPDFFKLQGGNWVQKQKSVPGEADARPASAGANEPQTQETEGECLEGCEFTLYGKMDSSGWWNFDKPHPEYTCVKVRAAEPVDAVKDAGLDYFGVSFGQRASDGSFELNVLKNKRLKIFAVRRPAKKRGGAVAALPEITTPATTAFAKGDGRCTEVGSLQLRDVPIEIFKKRDAFLRAIGMPEL